MAQVKVNVSNYDELVEKTKTYTLGSYPHEYSFYIKDRHIYTLNNRTTNSQYTLENFQDPDFDWSMYVDELLDGLELEEGK